MIELLVVIAIIAILAAILLPVLSRAKAASKKAVCVSNTRQLSLGVILYTADSDDVLPPTQNGDSILWPDLLDPYIKSSKVRLCPDDPMAQSSYGLNELVFVDFTDYLPGIPSSVPTASQLQHPSETVMVGELGTEDDLVTARDSAYKLTVPDGDLNDEFDARPSARHFNQCNIAFFDGHAGSRKLEQFYINQVPQDRWFCLDRDDANLCHSRE